MTSTIKVDTIQDSGGNTIISSDGSGTITQTASIGSFSSTGIDDNASSTAITIDSSQRVGIGISSPDSRLEVLDSSGTGIISRSSSTQATDTNKALRVRNNSDTNTFSVSYKGSVFLGSGTGIYFDGSTSGSNALDDYEEGTFTPTLVGGTTTTYTSQLGTYTKVGDIVYCHVRLQINSKGNGSGNQITGFPFTANSPSGNGHHASFGYFNSDVNVISLFSNLASTNLEIYGRNTAGATPTNPFNLFNDGKRLDFSIVYKTA